MVTLGTLFEEINYCVYELWRDIYKVTLLSKIFTTQM